MWQFVKNQVELLATFFAGIVIIIWGCATLVAPLLHFFPFIIIFN